MSAPETCSQPLALRFDESGLIPVVAQNAESGEVLLVAYMNAEALACTLDEGILVLWSRSRGALWRKGEQSGNVLRLRELRVNCEGNSLLARVALEGSGACHEGYRSCYYRRLELQPMQSDGTLRVTVVEPRVFDPTMVYGATSRGSDSDSAQDEESDLNARLERDARALYAAYEWLRDGADAPGSNTAKLLRAPDRAATVALALARAAQELEELRGVLAGTHTHGGGDEDVVLEASQVAYWVMLAAIAAGHLYDAWNPHTAWLAGWHDEQNSPPSSTVTAELTDAYTLLLAAGALCRNAAIHPARVVAADLAAMRAKHGMRE